MDDGKETQAPAVCREGMYTDRVYRVRRCGQKDQQTAQAALPDAGRAGRIQPENLRGETNFGPTSLYSTLTLDAENEVHTAAEMRQIRNRFYRRLLYKYPNAKIVIVYGQGKSTSRFHLHMISDGIPEEEIGRIWGLGSVIEVRHLREHNYYMNENGNKVDHGRDYKALADYLHAHWRKEFGGHRYKARRNCVRPEPEPATEAVREYSVERPPVAPRGYVLVEARGTQYGYLYFKYVIPPERGRT